MPTFRTDKSRNLTFACCSIAAIAVAGVAAAPAAAAQPLPVSSPELLANGATGPAVKQLQRALRINVNGVFGADTRNAVIRFQRGHRLQADGIVGPETRRSLHLKVRIVPVPGSTSGTTVGSATGAGAYTIPASIVMCESGGNYAAVNPSTGAGGAYQILPSTWAAYGGTGLPQSAPPAEQNAIAAKIWASGGPSQWSC